MTGEATLAAMTTMRKQQFKQRTLQVLKLSNNTNKEQNAAVTKNVSGVRLRCHTMWHCNSTHPT